MENRITTTIYNYSPIKLQNLMVSWLGKRNLEQRFTPYFYHRLEDLEASEWYAFKELRVLQNQLLCDNVAQAYNGSEYYQRLFDSRSIKPEDIRNVDDLSNIPKLSKLELRNNVESIICANKKRKIIHGHTSGSTGTPIPLAYTPETLANEYATVWRMRRRFGIQLGDKHATFNGRVIVLEKQNDPPFWRFNKPGNQMLFSLYHMTKQNMKYYVDELNRHNFMYWQGYPSSIYLVAAYLAENDLYIQKPPKAIFTSSESLLAYHRDLIEERCRAPIYDRYGVSEFCVSMTQCEKGKYHVDMEFGIVEIEPHEETDELVRGSILCTSLWNAAMPLIRYEVGDVVTLSKHQCECGRQSQVVLEIDGRIEDYIVTSDGKRVGRMDHIFKDAFNVQESQIIQDSVEHIRVKIVRRPEYDDGDEYTLLREFRKRLGDEIKIDFEYVDEIPRLANGKFRAVISHIDEGKI